MKKVLVIFICLVVLFSAKITLAEEVTLCDSLAYAAEEIMFMRQENRDVTKIIESFRKNYRQEDFEILCGLLLMAYEEPCYVTEEAKRDAVIDFKNRIYLWCVTGKKGW
ncbi:MAG: hypothetical protein ACTSQE_17425 [Candidatus Heimdallarchaeaceae archaeon]